MDSRIEICRGYRVAWDAVGTPGGYLLVSSGVCTQEQELLSLLLHFPKAHV